MKTLAISHQLKLPVDAVTQKLAFLGRTGSGKTYGATKLAEEMLEAKAQIVAIDPVGVWWGLRVAADGKQSAFSIPVFGGLHGDIPLEPGAGAIIADLIVDREISAVLDVSQFLVSEQSRFAYEFATRFFHRKKSAPSAVHIFVEECQEFIPQNISGGSSGFESKMLGAFERLIKLGRNFGIGASLISQRPQEVNKKALNQTECLFAFQMTGPQERKTIKGWIAEKGLDEDIAEVLPHLKVGEAHVWSPQWLEISETIKIDRKKTADVSSTPKHGAKAIEPKELSPVDLEALREKMSATIEKAKQEDPRELRREITRLKSELMQAQKAAPAAKIEKKEVFVLKDSQIDRLEKLNRQFEELFERSGKQLELFSTSAITKLNALFARRIEVLTPINDAVAKTKFANTEPRPVSPSPAVAKQVRAAEGPARDGHKPLMRNRSADNMRSPIGSTAGDTFPIIDGELKISKTQQRILDALAWFESIGNYSPSTIQLGAVALIDATGGHFSNTVGPLSSHALINRGNGVVSLTDKGRQFARIPDNISTLAEYHNMLRRRVRQAKSAGGKTVEILDAIINRGGEQITAEEIGKEVGIDHTGGHFSNTIGPLGGLGLIRRDKGVVYPTEIIFPPIPA